MKMWLLKHKLLLYFFAIFGAILVITDMLSWIGFLFQDLYKIPVDDRKVSLLGGYYRRCYWRWRNYACCYFKYLQDG